VKEKAEALRLKPVMTEMGLILEPSDLWAA
jgi:hypothetical protein